MERIAEAQPKTDGAGKVRPPRRVGLRGRLSLGHVVMIVSGLLAMLLTFSLLRTREQTFQVAVAARDIPSGTPVDAGSFTFAEMQAGDDLLGTLIQRTETAEVAGWISTATIRAGDLVSRNHLLPPATGSALGAMSIPIEREHAVGGALNPGDRVDVIEVRDGQPRYLLRGAEVLAVGPSGTGGSLVESVGTFSVTIAVDPDAALQIASAIRDAGLEIVRSTGVPLETEPAPSPEPTTPET